MMSLMSLTLLMKVLNPAVGSLFSVAPGMINSHLVFQAERPTRRLSKVRAVRSMSDGSTLSKPVARKLENWRMSPNVPVPSVMEFTDGNQFGLPRFAVVAGYGM